MRNFRFGGAVVMFAFASSPLPAQRSTVHTIALGERARVVVPRGWQRPTMAIGTVNFVSPDSITLAVGDSGALFATPSSRGMQVDVSRGRMDPRRGLAYGALTGLVVGVLFGYAVGEDCGPESFVCYDRSETLPVGALGGMVAGGVLGAVMNTGERWERAQLPKGSREARLFSPAKHGLGLRIALQIRSSRHVIAVFRARG